MKKMILLPVLMLVAMQLNAAASGDVAPAPQKNYLRKIFAQARQDMSQKPAASAPAPVAVPPRVLEERRVQVLGNLVALRKAEFTRAANQDQVDSERVIYAADRYKQAKKNFEDYTGQEYTGQ